MRGATEVMGLVFCIVAASTCQRTQHGPSGVVAPVSVAPAESSAIACTPDIAPPPGQKKTYCAIDVGSNDVKLQIVSMDHDQRPESVHNQRQCRVRLGLGRKVFDPSTGVAKPLPARDVDLLLQVMKDMAGACTAGGGMLVGIDATQWARDATNVSQIRARVQRILGVDMEVLTPETEGLYGYAAATGNKPGRIALDPGSNSFQLSLWPRGDVGPTVITVALGYVRAAERFHDAESSASFASNRAHHQRELAARIEEALATTGRFAGTADIRRAGAAGRLEHELFVMGQDAAIHLAVGSQLRDAAGHWVGSQSEYDIRARSAGMLHDPRLGEIAAMLSRGDVGAWLARVSAADYGTLRAEPVRSLYGDRALANAVLIDEVTGELGLTATVIVPQETPVGLILAKVARSSPASTREHGSH